MRAVRAKHIHGLTWLVCGNYRRRYGESEVGGSASDGLLVRSWADGSRRRTGGERSVRGEYVTTILTESRLYTCIYIYMYPRFNYLHLPGRRRINQEINQAESSISGR
ncbi:uncharacterized protein LOC143259440 isoform X3 [Megalopta genalis]|uniref:uncharacterized protein LOC143259440 isoform X3 n=1 Tax=Megalopta genalis TaxID=115081 RepID=UPI003FD18190